ncbi:iron-sulfur cluster assembly scaffold protein [Algihabitans albus]|uniref:iron-sulfur cluster assembly scaffold protein n=1 Tax=Algihabitans albus TaxID=2164067 RepID=UPI000E5CFCCE|nr:iron-sulfur cluster assembly scaffold protein [Algihabitans albus]
MADDALKQLYNDRVMALARDIPRQERLQTPDATVQQVSPLCGSRITIDLKLQQDRVSDYGQTVRACTLGQAAASILARHVIGRSSAELHRVRTEMQAMLKEGGPPPGPPWEDLEVLLPARGVKSRHGSVLLAFEAVVKALDQIEAERSGGT